MTTAILVTTALIMWLIARSKGRPRNIPEWIALVVIAILIEALPLTVVVLAANGILPRGWMEILQRF